MDRRGRRGLREEEGDGRGGRRRRGGEYSFPSFRLMFYNITVKLRDFSDLLYAPVRPHNGVYRHLFPSQVKDYLQCVLLMNTLFPVS